MSQPRGSGVLVRARRTDVAAQPAKGAHAVTPVRLPHGADPTFELARAGLRVVQWHAARRGDGEDLALECEVVAARSTPPPSSPPPVPHAEGLVIAPGEVATAVQRVSALVLVRMGPPDDALLLTRYSTRTRRPGHWGLPGGGVEPGEEPIDAAARECWEETGQHVVPGALLGITSDHFVGRAPHGRLEDFHAIHLVYDGRCDRPGEPVVHDQGGSSDGAAWVSSVELPALPLTPMARRHLALGGIGLLAP